jgi:RimJ/RimL family protein N-acetyltransferase
MTEPFPALLTERLVMKCRAMADADALAAILNDKQLSYHLSHTPHPYTYQNATDDLMRILSRSASDLNLNRHVWLENENKLIGAVMILRREKFEMPELVYWFGSDYWSKGYAREALDSFIPFAFQNINEQAFSASVAQDNDRSITLLEKIGFVRQGEIWVETLYRGQRPSYHYQLQRPI